MSDSLDRHLAPLAPPASPLYKISLLLFQIVSLICLHLLHGHFLWWLGVSHWLNLVLNCNLLTWLWLWNLVGRGQGQGCYGADWCCRCLGGRFSQSLLLHPHDYHYPHYYRSIHSVHFRLSWLFNGLRIALRRRAGIWSLITKHASNDFSASFSSEPIIWHRSRRHHPRWLYLVSMSGIGRECGPEENGRIVDDPF